jgi:hypothetical protein
MVFVEVLKSDEWIEIPFEDIKKGDKFRYLYDSREYTAVSDAIWDEKSGDHVVCIGSSE